MKKLILMCILSNFFAFAQIGIGTTTPNGALDINSSTNGVVVPNVALTSRIVAAPIVNPNGGGAPLSGTLIWNTATTGTAPNNVTPGFYYWDGSTWVAIAGDGGKYWTLNGNSGTTGSNYIGTSDASSLKLSTNATERVRVLSGTGQVVINNTGAPFTNDRLSVYNTTATDNAIAAYSTSTGTGVYAQNTGTGYGIYGVSASSGYGVTGTNNSTGIGVFGSNSSTGYGVYGQNTSSTGYGVYGYQGSSGFGVRGYNASTGIGVYGTSAGGSFSTGAGVYGNANSSNGIGIYGTSSGTNGTGIFGYETATGGDGVYGEATQTGRFGVWGVNNNASGVGARGSSSGTTGIGVIGITSSATGTNIGVLGQSASNTGFGISGANTNSSGTGLIVSGNNTTQFYLGTGSGASMTGTNIGTLSLGTSTASGNGVIGVGNNLNSTIYSPSTGAGMVGIGTQFGAIGFATTYVNTNGSNNSISNGVNASAGGYFEVLNGGIAQTWSYVGVKDNSGTNRKIIGNGTVNTIVKDLEGKYVALSSPEAPENLFQDYGTGKLKNGKAHISIDPIFAKNIAVNDKHPLRVFVQLEGDCEGVYVSKKNQNGFDVTELKNGLSNTSFTYSIIANRADEINQDGTKAKYSDERFVNAPGPITKTKSELTRQTSNINNISFEIDKKANDTVNQSAEIIIKNRPVKEIRK
ncbi:MAG: hypothetical protein H7239_05620 [Flavobacterium sp.]|nr:hypothetical protein [Flavobacterium sp.]